MKYVSAALLVLSATAFVAADAQAQGQAQAPGPVAGKDYIEIPDGRPLDPVEGKVVVEEFFNYICPACNGFEPTLEAWEAKLPPYAQVAFIPATFRTDFVPYAKAYYAAVTLGLAEKTHKAVYEGIHRTHTLPAEGDKPDEAKIAAFYANYGVDADKFLSTMRSFGVDLKLKRATEHMKKLQVLSTPTIVVDGRYVVQGATYSQMLQTASALIEMVHDKAGKPSAPQ
ncbi:MAG TPA: thiol:disulfide interchange protein DsbA/DsbL [Gammaproteobacteria bacterium]|nr:thiol:disulfide interchange protein DsbA/DsbL [Gammaproteobacteria bacterium]